MLWEFKVIHPLLLSFTPLALFQGFRKYRRIDTETAFLASCFFMFVYTYFVILVNNTRTGTGIFFLAVIMSLLAKEIAPEILHRSLLLLAAFGLLASHYGTTYLFLFGLIFTLSVYVVSKYGIPNSIIKAAPRIRLREITLKNTTVTYAFFFSVIVLTWHMYLPHGRFGLTIRVFKTTINSLLNLFLVSQNSRATAVLTTQWNSISLQLLKLLYVMSGIFITLGLLDRLLNTISKSREAGEILGMALFFYIVLIVAFSPVAARAGIYRLFPIALVFLAPFCVKGFKLGIELIGKTIRETWKPSSTTVSGLFSVFLVIFLLLNSGVVSATATEDLSTNVLLTRPQLLDQGNDRELFFLFKQYNSESDYQSSKWLVNHMIPGEAVYSDARAATPLDHFFVDRPLSGLNHTSISKGNSWAEGEYIYIGEFNTRTGLITLKFSTVIKNFKNMEFKQYPNPELRHENEIYDNGYSSILLADRAKSPKTNKSQLH